jgi:hypothetical protein
LRSKTKKRPHEKVIGNQARIHREVRYTHVRIFLFLWQRPIASPVNLIAGTWTSPSCSRITLGCKRRKGRKLIKLAIPEKRTWDGFAIILANRASHPERMLNNKG